MKNLRENAKHIRKNRKAGCGMLKLSPSILTADFVELGKDIKALEEGGAEYLHLDVMDGNFVPNISFGIPLIETVRKHTNMVFDTHLMINEPIRYIERFAEAGSDIITVHVEACSNVKETIELIHGCGKKAGIAICPDTPAEAVYDYLDKCELVLAMSVNPGFGGQKFDERTYEKLKYLRRIIKSSGRDTDIEVDGGVKLYNAKAIIEAGANVLVAGTAILQGDIKENIAAFRNILDNTSEEI